MAEVKVTAKYLKAHPELKDQNVKVGDVVDVTEAPEGAAAPEVGTASTDGVETPPSTPEATPEAPEEAPENDVESVDVEYQNPSVGLTVRTFTLALHGKKFQALAAEFAATNGGTVLK